MAARDAGKPTLCSGAPGTRPLAPCGSRALDSLRARCNAGSSGLTQNTILWNVRETFQAPSSRPCHTLANARCRKREKNAPVKMFRPRQSVAPTCYAGGTSVPRPPRIPIRRGIRRGTSEWSAVRRRTLPRAQESRRPLPLERKRGGRIDAKGTRVPAWRPTCDLACRGGGGAHASTAIGRAAARAFCGRFRTI